jgi:hypothetical protein
LPDVKQLFGFRDKDKISSPILTASAQTSLGNGISPAQNQLTANNLRLIQYSGGPFEANKGVNLFVAPHIAREDSKSSNFSSASGSLSPLERGGHLPTLAKEVAESVLDSLSYTSFTPRSAASAFDDSLSTVAISKGLVRADSNFSGY